MAPVATASASSEVGVERLAELEVGHVAADLDGADGTVHHEQVADEPRRRDRDAA